MQAEIENILFKRFVNHPIPFELITMEELYKRCDEASYDQSNSHRIKFHALIIITEGNSTHYLDFKEKILAPGTILPLAKDQVHAFNKDLKVKGYIISFEESFITQNISEKNLFHFLHIYHTQRIQVEEKDISTLLPFLELLKDLHLDTNERMKSEIVNSSFLALLFQIKRLSIYQPETFDSRRFKDFINFQQLITEHYSESHNAKDYADKLSVSYKYLNEVCKQLGHKTAKSFLDNWLLLEAKRNISERRYTSQEIAYKMGFNEPSNFIRFFKKFTGLTPNQFQKELK